MAKSLIPEDPNILRIIPFGGCGEFGMNLTAYLFRKNMFVVDCGIMHADATKLGTEAVIPQVEPYFSDAGGVTAYIITHGHEDHIGALPYFIERWPAPIYATPWTAVLIRNKFIQRGLGDKYKVTVVEAGDFIKTGDFEAKWIHVNHSIPMAACVLIRTPVGTVFHTGDFKFDLSANEESPVNINEFFEIGRQGVDLLVTDSTNSHIPGFSPSERTVVTPLTKVIANSRKKAGASILTTFSSNFWRLKTVFDVAGQLGKKIFVAGFGMDSTLATAETLGMYKAPSNVRVNEEQLNKVPRHDLIVLASGSQGEWNSGLMRIISGDHRHVQLRKDDRVIFSSRLIPGNEKPVLEAMNRCVAVGAEVLNSKSNPDIHVSGHAYQGELQLLISALNPKFYLPVHGSLFHLEANLENARLMGITPANSLRVRNGDVIDFNRDQGMVLVNRIDVDIEYIDSGNYLPMERAILRERLKIGELGAVFVSGVVSKNDTKWLHGPHIILRGIALPANKDPHDFALNAAGTLGREIISEILGGMNDPAAINEATRLTVRRQVADLIGRKPIAIAQIFVV